MRLIGLTFREALERKSQLFTSFFALLLGVSAVVAVRSITHFSEKAVARELDALGANVLILPKSVSLQDYYSADLHDEVIPEDYVSQLTNSNLEGLDNLSPKLSIPVEVAGKRITLTGILPRKEFQAKAAWQGAGIFARPTSGCGASEPSTEPPRETLVRKRVIEELAASDALVGADVARILKLNDGASIQLLDRTFKVLAVLPETGTVNDSRVFVHLHVVQEMTGKGAVVNAIEVVGCCQEISKGLVQKINALLPDAKVVTVVQVVDTQIHTNELMRNLSWLFVVVIVLVGGASIANYMYANVYERRREIGTLVALGATGGTVVKMFLLKGLLLGVAGGLGGYVVSWPRLSASGWLEFQCSRFRP